MSLANGFQAFQRKCKSFKGLGFRGVMCNNHLRGSLSTMHGVSSDRGHRDTEQAVNSKSSILRGGFGAKSLGISGFWEQDSQPVGCTKGLKFLEKLQGITLSRKHVLHDVWSIFWRTLYSMPIYARLTRHDN
jgi:hypothetical protein